MIKRSIHILFLLALILCFSSCKSSGADKSSKGDQEEQPAAVVSSIVTPKIEGHQLRGIHKAAFEGDLREIRNILRKDITKRTEKDEKGRVPVDYAAAKGYTDVVEYLITAGASTQDKDKAGWNVTHFASQSGKIEIMDILLINNAFIDTKTDEGLTPLHIASASGNSEMVQFLVAKGSGLDIKSDSGRTALHYSAIAGHPEVAEILIKNGANVNIEDSRGWSPIQLASHYKNNIVVQVLTPAVTGLTPEEIKKRFEEGKGDSKKIRLIKTETDTTGRKPTIVKTIDPEKTKDI